MTEAATEATEAAVAASLSLILLCFSFGTTKAAPASLPLPPPLSPPHLPLVPSLHYPALVLATCCQVLLPLAALLFDYIDEASCKLVLALTLLEV